MAVFSKPIELGKTLAALLQQEPTVLFAGAGVSARAKLPVWSSYLEYLAQVIEPKERLIADLIRKRINEDSFLLAAHYYKTCTEIPKGERYEKLAAPFKSEKYDAKNIYPLLHLPFTSIVTTNYDRALHDAYANINGKAALPIELDSSLKSAFFLTDFFIARIHGRAELPETMILDEDDYKKLYQDAAYSDFLQSLFMQRRCVFLGFSFTDPAITRILNFIAERGVLPKKHFAVVPESARSLIEQMSQRNIELVLYDSRDDHNVLWDGIDQARQLLTAGAMEVTQHQSSFETARRLLAVCYARAKMAEHSFALKNIIVQGIIISEIERGTTNVTDLPGRLQKYISLKQEEAAVLVSSAIDVLVDKEICLCDGDDIVIVNKMVDFEELSPAPILVTSIINRLMVREQYDVKPEIRIALKRIVEEVLIQRGFDLGAEFAGARFSSDLDPSSTIQKAIERNLPTYWHDRKSQIADAFLDLIRRPTHAEELLLAEVGRVSFGVEMVLQAGRSMMYQSSLPEMVYLDASVVLPAILPGHPYQRAYVQALDKLQQALETEGTAATILIADVFLNEIVTHRRNAINLVAEFGLEDKEVLRRRIQYYGADSGNVFVGAYSSWIARNGTGTFERFLDEEAPYVSEDSLTDFLKNMGIKVASTKPRSQEDTRLYELMKDRLLDGYERTEFGLVDRDRKALVLKKHEAAQVALLLGAIKEGRRAILVTADKLLRRVVKGLGIRELGDSLISHRNLVQLIDLLVGVPVDPSSLSRLLWTVRIADDRAAIKDYLITRALPQYDAALSLKMSDILDKLMGQIMHEARLEEIKFRSPFSSERVKETKFLDRIEGEVFAELAEEVKKLKNELNQRDDTRD